VDRLRLDRRAPEHQEPTVGEHIAPQAPRFSRSGERSTAKSALATRADLAVIARGMTRRAGVLGQLEETEHDE
jgi:hypothetical protein